MVAFQLLLSLVFLSPSPRALAVSVRYLALAISVPGALEALQRTQGLLPTLLEELKDYHASVASYYGTVVCCDDIRTVLFRCLIFFRGLVGYVCPLCGGRGEVARPLVD